MCVYTPRNRVKMDTRGTQFLNRSASVDENNLLPQPFERPFLNF